MKRLLKLAARLYPSSWRRRYSAGFEALLEDTTPRLRDLYDVLLGALKMQITTWTFTRITIAACLTGAVAAVALSFAIPSHYISATLILVNPSVTPVATSKNKADADEAFSSYLINLKSDVLGRDSLKPIIERLNLYPHERTNTPLDQVATTMQSNIRVFPVEGGGPPAFFVQFDYPDPRLAQQVDGELVALFMSSNLTHNWTYPAHFTLRATDEPNLPQSPAGLNRIQMAAVGLLIGLPTGLILALIIRLRRRSPAVSN